MINTLSTKTAAGGHERGRERSGAGWVSERARTASLTGSLHEKARAEVRSDRPEGLAPCFSKSSLRLEALNDTGRYMEKPISARSARSEHSSIIHEPRPPTNLQAVSSARSWRSDHEPSVVCDSQLQRIQDSVEFLGAREEEEEFEEDLNEMMRRSGGRSEVEDADADDAAREQRFSRARSLIQCGMIQQGEQILRDINHEIEKENRAKLADTVDSRGPRFLMKSKTAELFDNIFNAKASENSSVEGDLERERMNALRETRKEVEKKWQTSFHTTALQHTRDMWKLEHDSVDPSWSVVGGTCLLHVFEKSRGSSKIRISYDGTRTA